MLGLAGPGAPEVSVSGSTAVSKRQPRQRLSGALAGTPLPQRSQVRVIFMGLTQLAPILPVTTGKGDVRGQATF